MMFTLKSSSADGPARELYVVLESPDQPRSVSQLNGSSDWIRHADFRLAYVDNRGVPFIEASFDHRRRPLLFNIREQIGAHRLFITLDKDRAKQVQDGGIPAFDHSAGC